MVSVIIVNTVYAVMCFACTLIQLLLLFLKEAGLKAVR